MHLRLTGAVLVLLGLVAAGSGVASATLWRPADHVQAEAIAAGATTLVVTEPGVLELVDDTVTVRASAPAGSTVVLAVGREADVRAWVGLDPHTRVTGLADASTLAAEPGQPVAPPVETPPADDASPEPTDDASPDATDEATGEAADEADANGSENDDAPSSTAVEDLEATAPDPSGSDMWLVETSGEGSAELSWTREPGRFSLLVASTGPEAGPPTLELTWPREVATPWLWPGVWTGVGLALAGVALLVLGWTRSRRRDTWTEVAEPEPAVEVPTGPLTRRQLRELEAARASRTPATRRRRREGPAPTRVSPSAASPAATPGGEPTQPFVPASTVPSAPAPTATLSTPSLPSDLAASSTPTSSVPGSDVPGSSARAGGALAQGAPTHDAPAQVASAHDAPAQDASDQAASAQSPAPRVPAPGSTAPTTAPGPGAPAAPETGLPSRLPRREVTGAPADAAPFVPTFEPQRPGGVVPHVPSRPPAAGAQPSSRWPSVSAGPVDTGPGTTAPAAHSGAAAAPPERTEPGGAPTGETDPAAASQARLRSRTGKFFQRRREQPSAPPTPEPTAPPEAPAGGPVEPGPVVEPQPTTWDAGRPVGSPPPSSSSPGRDASADAWRARWGFVEVPIEDDDEDGGTA